MVEMTATKNSKNTAPDKKFCNGSTEKALKLVEKLKNS